MKDATRTLIGWVVLKDGEYATGDSDNRTADPRRAFVFTDEGADMHSGGQAWATVHRDSCHEGGKVLRRTSMFRRVVRKETSR
jgi:hypothetical protein